MPKPDYVLLFLGVGMGVLLPTFFPLNIVFAFLAGVIAGGSVCLYIVLTTE